MEFSESWIYFYLFALMANHSKGNASVVSTPACLLMQRATCGLTIPDDSCVKRIDDFVVTMALYGTKSDCEKLDLSPYISCLKELRKASKYVGISGDYILDYPCMSKGCGIDASDCGNISNKLTSTSIHLTDDETFPMSPAGLAVMFLGGILTGVLVTSFIFIVYIRWMKDQTSKQENTYLDLDLSVDNEEKQPERTQRGSVAFVREIASVYYSQPVNVEEESPKDRSSSVRSRIFSWSSSKSRKSFTDRKSSLNKIPYNSKSAAKQMFSYEQPVPEEGNDYVDLDSPTTSTQKLDYENEKTEHKNKSNPITFIDADEDQTKNPLNVLENQTEKSIHNYATTDELHSKTENPYSDNKQKTTDQI